MPRQKRKQAKKEAKRNNAKVSKAVYWTPRILSIIFILFISLFALDVFDKANNYDFWQTMIALFMHLIPSFVLLAIVLISWKHEIVGGIAFSLFGAAYILLLSARVMGNPEMPPLMALAWSLQIAGPAILTGILFMRCWFLKRRK